MPEYAIQFARSARKELHALDAPVADRILRAIDSLAKKPRPAGCKKLKGVENLWRIRIGE